MVHIINILFKFLKKGRSDKYERTSIEGLMTTAMNSLPKYG